MENDIMVKLRALLNMTQANGCTQSEAETAMEMAQKIMLEHNLSRGSLFTDNPETQKQGIGKIDHSETSGFQWRSMLAGVLARNTLCKVIRSPSEKTWHIFGTYDNVRAVMEMYQWLTIQLESQGLRDFKSYRNNGGTENGRTWKTGFFQGAITAINDRLKRPMADFANGNGHAIVIYNDKAVGEAIKRVFPHTTSSYTRAVYSSGREYGIRAGNGISLTPTRNLHSGMLRLAAG
jgi:hypothetical protein